jgi:hypothetical protein
LPEFRSNNLNGKIDGGQKLNVINMKPMLPILNLVVSFSLCLVGTGQNNKVKQICTDAIFIRDSIVDIGDLKKCKDFNCENTEVYGFVIDFINDNISPGLKSKLEGVFPGPPIVSLRLIDSLGLKNPINGQRAENIYFSPETGANSGSSTIHDLPPRLGYDFIPFPISEQKKNAVIGNLERIKKHGLYDKFKKRPYKELPFFVSTDEFACYTQFYNLEDSSTFKGIYQINTFKDEKPIRLWVECYIPVDTNWIPVGMPSRVVRPIALETSKGLYLYAQIIVPSFGNGGTIDQYEGKVFDLSKAKDYNSTYQKVLSIFNEEINKQFTANPISSILKSSPVPNQVRFQRLYDKSIILEGFTGPYYELTTYTIFLWTGPDKGFLGSGLEYQLHDYLKNSNRNDQIFLQVNQSLQVSVGKIGKKYIEPEEYQYVAYKKVISKAISEAVKNTTLRLKGEFINEIGIIK